MGKKVYLGSAWFEYCEPFFMMAIDADRFSEKEAEKIFDEQLEEVVENYALDCETDEEVEQLKDSVCVSPLSKEDTEDVIDDTVLSDSEKRTIYHDLETMGYAFIPTP